MKKIEAKALAPEKSKLVIEYITQILSDSEKVNSIMDFWYAKIDTQLKANEKMIFKSLHYAANSYLGK